MSVLSIAELPLEPVRRTSTGEPLSLCAEVGVRLGLSALRLERHVLPPGRRAFPAHRHSHREEALYILSGELTVTLGAACWTATAGQVVALPPGEDFHSAENRGTLPVEYLSMSASAEPDTVTLHPEELPRWPAR